MEKHSLLRSQKNLILQAIVEAGFNPSNFHWSEQESSRYKVIISVLNYTSSGYFFSFDYNFVSTFSPDETMLVNTQNLGSWDLQWQVLQSWLVCLKRETEAPDLWSTIAQESELLDATDSGNDNSSFNKEEKKYIISAIDEIRKYLLEVHKMDAEIVEPRLKYLEESSERLGRKDWKNVLLSVIIGIILNATVTPESSRDILRFAGTVLHQILQHLTLLK